MPHQSSSSPHPDSEHSYRAYVIGKDGHIVLRIDLDCDDDEAAMGKAQAHVDGHDVELWDGAQKITTFKAQ